MEENTRTAAAGSATGHLWLWERSDDMGGKTQQSSAQLKKTTCTKQTRQTKKPK